MKPQKLFLGPKPLSKVIPEAMQPAFKYRSSVEATLLLNWPKIIKADFAKRCYPERLIFSSQKQEGGILLMAVDSSSSLLIQHSEGLLVDAINSYFGYQLVLRLRLKHTHILQKKVSSTLSSSDLPLRRPHKIQEHPLPGEIEEIQDQELKNALLRFSQAFYEFHAQRLNK